MHGLKWSINSTCIVQELLALHLAVHLGQPDRDQLLVFLVPGLLPIRLLCVRLEGRRDRDERYELAQSDLAALHPRGHATDQTALLARQVRSDVILNARIAIVGKYQSCMCLNYWRDRFGGRPLYIMGALIGLSCIRPFVYAALGGSRYLFTTILLLQGACTINRPLINMHD